MKNIYLFSASLLLLGCAGGESNASSNQVTWSEIATTRQLESNIKKKYLIFANQQSLSNTLMELSLADQNVDFRKYKVIMLGIGEHGEGDSVSINSVKETDNYVQVNIGVEHFDEHCISIDIAHSSINTFYKIKSTKEMVISEELKTKACPTQ